MTTVNEIDSLVASGDIVWRNDRYGATYALDRKELQVLLAGQCPSSSWASSRLSRPS